MLRILLNNGKKKVEIIILMHYEFANKLWKCGFRQVVLKTHNEQQFCEYIYSVYLLSPIITNEMKLSS